MKLSVDSPRQSLRGNYERACVRVRVNDWMVGEKHFRPKYAKIIVSLTELLLELHIMKGDNIDCITLAIFNLGLLQTFNDEHSYWFGMLLLPLLLLMMKMIMMIIVIIMMCVCVCGCVCLMLHAPTFSQSHREKK